MAENLSGLVERLRSSLAKVVADPQEPLDKSLLEKCRDTLTFSSESDLRSLVPTLLPELLSLLPLLQQDPTPVVYLTVKLVEPLSFADVLTYTSGPPVLAEALRSPSKPVNQLAVGVLMKAAASTGDVAMIAGMKDVVSELISAYLLRDTEVSAAISILLGRFMETDYSGGYEAEVDVPMGGTGDEQQTPRPRGQGLMWRRLFEDRDIYTEFFALTSLKHGGEISKSDITIAQARLLALLPRLAKLDFDTVKRSHFPEVESQYGLKAGEEGLLGYAALHMVGTKHDVLMHMTLLEFYTTLLSTVVPIKTALSSSSNTSLSAKHHSSPTLDFLISKGIHTRAMTYYLYPDSRDMDSIDVSFLSGRSANYIARYASTYPKHILTAKSTNSDNLLIDDILPRIRLALEDSRSRREFPSQDTHILASLPRVALLARTAPIHRRDAWNHSPLSRIPVPAIHPDYLKTLAFIFRNHDDDEEEALFESAADGQGPAQHDDAEAAATRALFLLYLDHNPKLFTHLVSAADTVALKDMALAAIAVLSALMHAVWKPLPTTDTLPSPSPQPTTTTTTTTSTFSLPTESQLQSWLRNIPAAYAEYGLPATGLDVLLSAPAKAVVVPYLCSPPRTFTHLVGGRGDAESAAYQVAVAKYKTLKRLWDVLRRPSYQRRYADVKALVGSAVNRGLWGGAANAGGSVGTLEL
ncbi:MAG: hypothetical protein M1816_007551 [Peltula sp. TS41687]|nr:MAG: hypothetical protein M1816_007551 [Peltula sp. TS41687]